MGWSKTSLFTVIQSQTPFDFNVALYRVSKDLFHQKMVFSDQDLLSEKNNFLLGSGEENRSYFFHLISAGKLGKVDLT